VDDPPLKRFQAKWKPVRRPETQQNNAFSRPWIPSSRLIAEIVRLARAVSFLFVPAIKNGRA